MRYTRKSSVTSLPSRQVAFCPICTNLTCSLCLLCLSSAAVCGISRGLVMEMVFKNVFLCIGFQREGSQHLPCTSSLADTVLGALQISSCVILVRDVDNPGIEWGQAPLPSPKS